MLDADRALELTRAAGGALEGGFLRIEFAEEGLVALGAEFVEVAAQAEDNFLGVEELAGIGCGAMLSAAAALDARVSLEACELGQIGASDKSEVFIADQWWDEAEAAAREEDGGRAHDQVQVLSVRDQRKKNEERESVNPPEGEGCGAGFWDEEGGEVGRHEGEDEEGDEAGFIRKMSAEPDGADEEAADEKIENAEGASDGEKRGEVKVKASEEAGGGEETGSESYGAMVDRDEREGEKAPKDKGMSESGDGALANDFGLKQNLRDELPNAPSDGSEMEVDVFLGGEDFAEDDAEAAPEEAE